MFQSLPYRLNGSFYREEWFVVCADRESNGLKTYAHVVAFLLLAGLNAAHTVNDWLFYTDIKEMGKGIVYGEPDQDAARALLAFSIIGTLAFIFELTNLWRESFLEDGETSWLDSDLLSALVIWAVDIPQMIISFSLCREEPISVFQLGKACVIIIGIFVRILVSLVKYCNKNPSPHHVSYKVCIILGTIIEFVFALGIIVLTKTRLDDSSTTTTTILDDQRYFANVSIFGSAFTSARQI
ncbi:hypothetical protein Bpfe_015640 [Biomphalaria pfeifferi]|uniref:Uncharacterized protein n=1 Tax=Biomphalaria pfeifferi TaxID=112525 RepID=A0AAD8BI75_BIOPF|nr:hypothetical protein Bpfe_015640 [Biomphalaria pfeifferi]